MKLLLHTCCGPCFLGVWEELGTHKDIETTLYYDNPNIYPEEEWEKRRDNLRAVADNKSLTLVEVDYEPGQYLELLNSVIPANAGIHEKEDGSLGLRPRMTIELRCPRCYRIRLENTAKYAKENGFDAISTTLFVSPYQQHEVLKKVAEDVAHNYGLDFYYTDWRPYFREGQNKAIELNIYRQRYCGCEFSLKESSATN